MNGDQCSTTSSSSVLICDKENTVRVSWSIADFKIKEELYSSAGSTIFKAKEVLSEELCVLKRISKSYALTQHESVQVEREIRVHSNLRHRNVIRMLAWFHDRLSIYMVTELGDLTVSHMLRTQYPSGIPERVCQTYIDDFMNGLKYLHAHHVIHRDLKPLNLFIKDNVLKIGDFGSCVHTLDMRKSLCGSVPYMSPEMVGSGVYSFPHDIWSLGISVHEMLTNTLFFDGNSPMEIYKKIVKDIYTPPPSVSAEMSNLLISCLEKNPLKRKKF